jgi:hypothetical protein
MLLVTAPGFSPLGLATVPAVREARVRLGAVGLVATFGPFVLPPLPTVPALGAAAIRLACVARLLPLAVFSRPPRAVAPLPALEKRPLLSRE